MPTVIRRSETITLTEKRREILHAVGWQVTQSIWSPPTDVYETEKEYIVRVEIAGMREADFEVIFENGFLFIGGVRPERFGTTRLSSNGNPLWKIFYIHRGSGTG